MRQRCRGTTRLWQLRRRVRQSKHGCGNHESCQGVKWDFKQLRQQRHQRHHCHRVFSLERLAISLRSHPLASLVPHLATHFLTTQWDFHLRELIMHILEKIFEQSICVCLGSGVVERVANATISVVEKFIRLLFYCCKQAFILLLYFDSWLKSWQTIFVPLKRAVKLTARLCIGCEAARHDNGRLYVRCSQALATPPKYVVRERLNIYVYILTFNFWFLFLFCGRQTVISLALTCVVTATFCLLMEFEQ